MKVRECYTAALKSGARPSGSPKYRNEDCSCFNAAVEDLDGNTVEFIFRQPHGDDGCCGEAVQQLEQRSIQDEEDAEDAAQDDTQSIAQSVRSQGSSQFRARSSMQTALDLASTTSKSSRSELPRRGLSRINTEPTQSNFPSRTLVGTVLGAAAGAALMYAMSRAERINAKEEADHLAAMNLKMRSSSETRKDLSDAEVAPSPALKDPSVARSEVPVSYPAPPSVRDMRKSHRNFSTTESAFSTRHPARPTTQAMRMLEATGHNADEDVQEALSRHNSLRAMPTRSKTQDEYAYAPASRTGRSEYREEQRSSTGPMQDLKPLQYLLEGPKSILSRRSTTRRHSPTRSASRSSHNDHVIKETAELHRNDSGMSVHSSARSHHHRERGSDTGRDSSTSTTKPSRRDSANHETVPQPSEVPSNAPSLLIETAAYYPAAISLPASVASTCRPSSSGRTPAAIPPIHHSEQSWEQFTAGEESDGLGDIKTVVPDDSISCVDLSKHRRRRTSKQVGESSESGRSHHRKNHTSSRHGSRRSEASESTVKPVRRTTEKEERSGKRSIFGF